MKIIKNISVVLLILLCSCASNKEESKEDTRPYFEGIIKLSESRGLYGSLFKVHTTYYLSENILKREQKLGGIGSFFGQNAGCIIDLKKDSVTLYYSDKISKTNKKHTLSVAAYKDYIKANEFPNSLPSPVDATFKLLPDYQLTKQIKDSTKVQDFLSDYTLYKDSTNILKQEVFDTKEVKVKRELLEMAFINLPKEINFMLKSDVRTTISDISNDTIISGTQTKALDAFVRDVFKGKDSVKKNKRTNLEKLAKNKWVNMGLNILKKGIDLNIHITTDVSELTIKKLTVDEFSLPSSDFIEIDDIDEFINSLPKEGDGDFEFDD